MFVKLVAFRMNGRAARFGTYCNISLPFESRVHVRKLNSTVAGVSLYVSITKNNQLMLYGEITAVYFNNHKKHLTVWARGTGL